MSILANYITVDLIEKITLADSFIANPNKIGTGNGEAKLYIGHESQELRNFYGAKGFHSNFLIKKSDLISFMNECQSEYLYPQQNYRNRSHMTQLWHDRISMINKLQEIEYFTISEQTQIQGNRIYVKSSSLIYQLIREIALPNLSYLSIAKITDGKNIYYYLRPFTHILTTPIDNIVDIPDIIAIEEITITEKEQIIQARVGQGRFRANLLKDCPFCPITQVSDERLLIASHIKPWKYATNTERLDYKNGFMLTPTYDRLFDQGLISFDSNKTMLISPWLKQMTCQQLGLAEKIFPQLPINGRQNYLEFHRHEIFKA